MAILLPRIAFLFYFVANFSITQHFVVVCVINYYYHLSRPRNLRPSGPTNYTFIVVWGTVHAPGLNSTQQSRVPVTAKAGRGRSTRRAPGPLSYASSLTCRTTAHASFVTAGSRSHPHARSLTQAHIQSCHGVWKFHSNKKNWILSIPLNFIKFSKI
jgi:hypothetical protein